MTAKTNTKKTKTAKSKAGSASPEASQVPDLGQGEVGPFVLIVRARGVEVDIRVDDRGQMSRVSDAISNGLQPYIPALIGAIQGVHGHGYRGSDHSVSLVDLVVAAIRDDVRSPDDVEIDQLLDVLGKERDRRAESRS